VHLGEQVELEPGEVGGRAFGEELAGVGGEGVEVDELVDRHAQALQRAHHRAGGELLLFLFQRGFER